MAKLKRIWPKRATTRARCVVPGFMMRLGCLSNVCVCVCLMNSSNFVCVCGMPHASERFN